MDFQEQNRLYKVRTTVLEMIADRGIHVPDGYHLTFEEFKVLFESENMDIYIHDEEKNKRVYVHFHMKNSTINKNDLKSLMNNVLEEYEDEEVSVIIILKEKENSIVTKELLKPIYRNVEIFLQKYMSFNITHHILVPKHIPLTEEEEAELVEKYNKSKLPKIMKTDPISRYYGMKIDQVFKIIRNSNVSGESIYYRVVK